MSKSFRADSFDDEYDHHNELKKLHESAKAFRRKRKETRVVEEVDKNEDNFNNSELD